ncbi:tetratricopeptide repeat protein [Rhabdochromatium marinum]|uniref:tetratricopeptide repeat protein n=1 Tax=Rhabdochromatium marinum TaxID=48729 RepID=UPI001906E12A|nr:tetratricopeptide repeat protein [Rhabdochromatium marinum]MBK1650204.1 hypothetical protein [Rhabdochromatium marinum]
MFRFLIGLILAASAQAGTDARPSYVGQARCAPCHAEETTRWRGSHHDLAMQEATGETVLGDFGEREFEHLGLRSRFYRKDGAFMVRTDGPDGELHEYPIEYTFGVYPLQQYLIAFPGGRLQALDIAWDSRPKEAGGQRWMHLHPDDPVRHDDVLHWTGPNLNWNYMCADCHSTNLRKGYDAQADSYDTTWSEIDVSCEACHGPGSDHLRWAKAQAQPRDEVQKSPDVAALDPNVFDRALPNMGLTVRLDEREGVAWPIDPATGQAQRSKPRITSQEIQVCARCHSRRSQLTDQTQAGDPLLDAFRPALLSEGLYHADGQVGDEVYVWGSLLQSKMYQAGITCSDCHDPHSADLRLPGDQVCSQCHAPDRYATKAHHFHPEDSTGASCIECHMLAKHYMVVDARHEHSFRVPRPDQSVALGTPNACTNCHTDKSAQWAADQVVAWYGQVPTGLQAYAPALHAARTGQPEAGALLQAIAVDSGQPGIARATALQALGGYPSPVMLEAIKQGLAAKDPLRRLGALAALDGLGTRERLLAVPLLEDDLKAVRTEAARLLVAVPDDQLAPEAQVQRAQGIEEYIAARQFNAERPEAQFNLAGLYADQGRVQDAEQHYRAAIRLQPQFIPAYVNLAQLLSKNGREGEAEATLRAGLEQQPDSADLHHARGLSLIRQKASGPALAELAKAAELAPENARYGYVHAVALHASGQSDAAIAALARVHRQRPGDIDTLSALISYHSEAGQLRQALDYAQRLQQLQPGNPNIARLVTQLQAAVH